MEEQKTIDIAVLGATGFTGQFVVETLVDKALEPHSPHKITICAAARNVQRLEQKHRDLWHLYKDLELVVVDVTNHDALVELTRRSRVMVNCVGPFDLTGDLVVRACFEGKCEYCDISGEPRYIRRLVSSFHDEAVQEKLRIVPAVGLDSIPADLGTLYVLEQMPKQKKFWERAGTGKPSTGKDDVFVTVTNNVRLSGGGLSGGTYHTLINSFDRHSKKWVDETISKTSTMSRDKNDKKRRLSRWPQWNNDLQSYAVPFPTSDPTVVARSKYLDKYYLDGKVDFEFGNYLQLKKLWHVAAFVVAALLFAIAASFSIGRSVLSRLWYKQGEGPSEQDAFVQFDLIGQSKSIHGSHKVHAVLHCGPSYRTTGQMASEFALLMLATKSSKDKYGVLSPASTFGMELVRRLRHAGVLKFEMKSVNFERSESTEDDDNDDEGIEQDIKKFIYMK